jgi:hypothetical protein
VTAGPDKDGLHEAIVLALKGGPMSPRDVMKIVGGDQHAMRYAFKRLELAGQVKAEGTTNNRKWMLAKPAKPAKEDH